MTALSRRAALTAALSTVALAACSSKSTSTTSTSTAKPSTATTPPLKVQPVDGFASKPTWDSRSLPGALTGYNQEDIKPQAVWSQDHAWFLLPTRDNATKLVAYNPKTGKEIAVATTSDISLSTGLMPVVAPSPGVLLGDQRCATLTGDRITIKTIPSEKSGHYLGDAFVAQASSHASNPSESAIYNPRTNTWDSLKADGGGTPVAATLDGGTTRPISIDQAEGSKPTLSYNGHSITDANVGEVIWAQNGIIVTRNQADKTVTVLTPALQAQSGHPNSSNENDNDAPTAISADRKAAIITSGHYLDLSTPTRPVLKDGAYQDTEKESWALINTAAQPGGIIFANGDNEGAAEAGAYTSTTGSFQGVQPNPSRTAPALILPNGAGVFYSDGAWGIYPKS